MSNIKHPHTAVAKTMMMLLFFSCVVLVSCSISYGSSATTDQENKQCPLFSESTESIFWLSCKKCHQKTYNQLQNQGGKHRRISCRKCHVQIQKYIAGKTKYEDIKPTCVQCHKPPHGEKLVDCNSCHQVAHAPRHIPAGHTLTDACYICHEKLDKELKTFITQHTEMYCTGCHHSKHRYTPNCLECHQPHQGTFPAAGPFIENDSPLGQCLTCHPPHKALKVVYPNDTPNNICAFCHRKASEMLRISNTKHTPIQCSFCHPDKHRTIKRCKKCHGTPHSRTTSQQAATPDNFTVCGECHGIAHSVRKPLFSPQTVCGDCHEKKTSAYAKKNGLWLHGPVNRTNCTPCHQSHQAEIKSPFKHKLTNEGEKLCVICHVEGLLRLTKSHQESTKCLQCHNPHLGKNSYLLIKDYEEIKQFPEPPANTD